MRVWLTVTVYERERVMGGGGGWIGMRAGREKVFAGGCKISYLVDEEGVEATRHKAFNALPVRSWQQTGVIITEA